MRTSTRFAIGIHALIFIHLNKVMPNSSEILAKSAQTNPSFIRKVLSRLIRAGLVKGKRGSSNYTLQKQPTEISLLEIYRAVEKGGQPTIGCGAHNPAHECSVTGSTIHSMLEYSFSKMEQVLEAELKKISLAEVMSKAKNA